MSDRGIRFGGAGELGNRESSWAIERSRDIEKERSERQREKTASRRANVDDRTTHSLRRRKEEDVQSALWLL